MPRQPKLRPKTHIPGLPESLYDLATIPRLSDVEGCPGIAEQKGEQRVFRVKRKHVLKACDRCRVKKTKCDGKQPCNRCSAYNHPCLFREKKATHTKVYSRGFVEMLESHHSLVVKALQQLYKHCVNNEGFPGEPLEEGDNGHPLTHAILDRLGLIKQAEENTGEPEEESDDLLYLKSLSTSTECSATTDPSPEPITPPESSSNNCSPVDAPLPLPSPLDGDGGKPFKWGFPMIPPTQTPLADQYHDYSDPGYQHLLMMSRQALGPATSDLGGGAVPASVPGQHNIPYWYYNADQDPAKSHHIHPPMMTGLDPHQAAAAAGLSVDVDMLSDFHLPLHEQQQQQSLYSTTSVTPATPLAPGWSFSPSG